MIFKSFNFQIIIRSAFLIINSFWLSWILLISIQGVKSFQLYTFLLAFLVLILQVFLLIRYIHKTNYHLAMLFSSIDDSSNNYSLNLSSRGKSFQKLSRSLNQLIQSIAGARIEKEEQNVLIQAIIQHVHFGIIVIDQDQKILFYNSSFMELFKPLKRHAFHRVEDLPKDMQKGIEAMEEGESQVLKIHLPSGYFMLSAQLSIVRLRDRMVKLFSIKDFSREYDKTEIESWQKLTRVLTHEIMNSVTPIATLNLALQNCLKNLSSDISYDQSLIKDAQLNARLIEERTEGIKKFVNSYRSISSFPQLKIVKICIPDVIKEVEHLFRNQMTNNGIVFKMKHHSREEYAFGDQMLLRQVLINLIKNAVEALMDVKNPTIAIQSEIEEKNKCRIAISNNGMKIEDDDLEKIFIPFYTTKSQGGGIGLSFSRQVLIAHNGTLKVLSDVGETKFIMEF